MRKIIVRDPNEGLREAEKILYKNSDSKTVLFLSGGSTPKPLYFQLAKEKKIKIGSIAMADDRYSFHEQYSNEIMIKESGIVRLLEKLGGAFFSILEYGLNLPKTAERYDNDVRFLFSKFPKRIAVLGIGVDGHIASLPAGIQNSKFKIQNLEYVSYVRSFPAEPKVPRISLNLHALSLMDFLIVLAFGKEKSEGIRIALKTFFKGDLSKKTILITDQKV